MLGQQARDVAALAGLMPTAMLAFHDFHKGGVRAS